MIRAAVPEDSEAIAELVVAAGMFSLEEVDVVRQMLRDYFDAGGEEGHVCVVDDDADDGIVGVAYHQPKGIADRVWDLTMIAVRPGLQGAGRGAALMAHAEDDVRARGGRLLLVDTSGTAQYDRTRQFYCKLGYDEEARIRDFWEPGDDLVVFRKALGADALTQRR